MRIIIEIDGDNVAVHTDRQLSETDTAKVVDAGSAPVELLRQYGGEVSETPDVAQSPQGKRGAVKLRKDTPLNPLRAGEAIARQLVKSGGSEGELYEIIDGGRAPGLPKVSRKEDTPKQARRRKR